MLAGHFPNDCIVFGLDVHYVETHSLTPENAQWVQRNPAAAGLAFLRGLAERQRHGQILDCYDGTNFSIGDHTHCIYINNEQVSAEAMRREIDSGNRDLGPFGMLDDDMMRRMSQMIPHIVPPEETRIITHLEIGTHYNPGSFNTFFLKECGISW